MSYKIEQGTIQKNAKGFWIIDEWGKQKAFVPKPADCSWAAFESQCMVVAKSFDMHRAMIIGRFDAHVSQRDVDAIYVSAKRISDAIKSGLDMGEE